MRSRDFTMNVKSESLRLETPYLTGFRAGMSTSSMIARRLGRLYDLPADTPREICDLLQALDRKTYQPN